MLMNLEIMNIKDFFELFFVIAAGLAMPFIVIENLAKVEEVREIDSKYEVPSFEEFMKTYEEYIDKEEFAEIKEKALIIDVRDKLEHQTLETFPNSINITYEDLINEPAKYVPDKNKLIIVYCNFGHRSSKAVCFLRSQGYSRALVLNGGIYGAN
ncbi:21012_t:CDS:2 [Entrophospora sp. SA101]|nr:21012_t:CDS:2 [Entrophospora sp. SA101]